MLQRICCLFLWLLTPGGAIHPSQHSNRPTFHGYGHMIRPYIAMVEVWYISGEASIIGNHSHLWLHKQEPQAIVSLPVPVLPLFQAVHGAAVQKAPDLKQFICSSTRLSANYHVHTSLVCAFNWFVLCHPCNVVKLVAGNIPDVTSTGLRPLKKLVSYPLQGSVVNHLVLGVQGNFLGERILTCFCKPLKRLVYVAECVSDVQLFV